MGRKGNHKNAFCVRSLHNQCKPALINLLKTLDLDWQQREYSITVIPCSYRPAGSLVWGPTAPKQSLFTSVEVCGLTPARNHSPHSHLLTHTYLGGMGDRIRVEVRKLVGWYKDSSIGKARAVHTSKVKQGIHSLLPIHSQVFSHLQQSRAPSHTTVTQEDKMPWLQTPLPLFLFTHFYVLSMLPYGVGHPFGQLGSTVLAVSPPTQIVPPCPPHWWCEVRSRKGLGSVWALLSSSEAIPVTNPVFSTNPNTAPYQLLGRKLTLSQPKPAQKVKSSCAHTEQAHCNQQYRNKIIEIAGF